MNSSDTNNRNVRKLRLISREFAGFEASFGVQAEHFEKLSGWRVEREFEEIHKLYDRMVTSREALSGAHDLFLCVTDWLPEAIREGLLLPLDRFLQEDPPEGWPDAWAPSMRGLQTGEDGRIYGIAYHDGPEMFIYRSDLFTDGEERLAFAREYGYPLDVPATWKQFVDVAKFFTRPEQGMYGAVTASFPDGHNNVYDFLIHLWSRGGHLLTPDGKAAFQHEAGREALQFLVDLIHKHRVVPPEALEMDSVRSGDYFAQGGAAMMWNWAGFAAVADMPHMSKITGKVRTGLIPKGDGPQGRHMSLNIYWILGIAAGSRNPEAAYRFIKETASAEMDKATSLCGGNGTRLSTWRDEEVRRQFPYYEHIERVHQQVNSPPPIPEYPAMNEVLSHMVNDALRLKKDVASALDQAAKQIDDILAHRRA
ncbi:sugar ABC transporter substrate-binding protein [Paenibacillus doosanensis]|uniref:ABC transporter-binding protein n=1 Tax=Paenibacillus konkukensis TaxID=2020716 RepID=A0ABY4RJP0_9BACL|nr:MULTISPECIES: sugar ABC transporter substrate-binding protein [Paenibacillus]MCS7459803.1 sugar ABC transporter substrate-binding protein [Paenibacillus doosanensis]UQZ81778.1 putative ABC transporter-binding protein precursor [Paenibacillus konkukensis]